MNDLIKDVRVSSSIIKKEEFPEKSKMAPVMITSLKISENAVHKKEKNDLTHRYLLIEKNYNKITKKNSDLTEEFKNIKMQFDSNKKDYNVLTLTNERIQNEKITIEKTLEDNKNYTRKLESRLLFGIKNQNLIEINIKLTKEIEDFKVKFELSQIELAARSNEIDKIKTAFDKKTQEIKILNKALEINADDLKFKGDLKSSILYDVGMCKQEIDDYKEKYEKILEINDNFKKEVRPRL